MITVGTGIGGAALENGSLWHGGGFSDQFGHIVVAEDGLPCNCGRNGCVETFSSGIALGRLIAEAGLPEETRAEDIVSCAEAGERMAATVLDSWARPMQRAIETLVAVADPRLILNCGGFDGEIATPMETDIDVFDKVISVKARGALLVTKYASRNMIRLARAGPS